MVVDRGFPCPGPGQRSRHDVSGMHETGQDGGMRDTRIAAQDGMRAAIERSGYYPGLVYDAVSSALGAESVVSYVVTHDTLFDPGMEVRRHMTVLALTPTRLVYSHTDESPAEPGDADSRPMAETSTEAVRVSQISSVAVTRVGPDPASYVPGSTMPSEVVLTIGWNVLSHIELEPAHCGDDSCQADHGYTGTVTADHPTIRAGEGADARAGGRGGGARPRPPGRVRRRRAEPDVAAEEEPMTSEGQPAVIADLPASLPTVPRYGESSLADLATSVLASLGVAGEANPLELQSAERVCLLVVDGLGWELLREHPAAAPFLSELAVAGRPLKGGFPATTATSLASLGTGRPPGQPGGLGYQVAVPGEGRLLNALRWDSRVDPVAWQPGSTVFERATAAGVASFRVAQHSLAGTGLSIATMRGAEVVPADTLGALVAEAAAVLRSADRAVGMGC